MYPPKTVYILSYYDVHDEVWKNKVYTCRDIAENVGGLTWATEQCTEYTVREARFVL